MSSVDPRSVEEARQQIRALVDEIDQLSKSDLAEADFFHTIKKFNGSASTKGLIALCNNAGKIFG